MEKLTLLTSSIFADVIKIAFFEISQCIADVSKICDDVIICKSRDLCSLIPNSLKNVSTKFQVSTVSRMGFIAIYLAAGQKAPPPPFKCKKKPAWDRVKT